MIEMALVTLTCVNGHASDLYFIVPHLLFSFYIREPEKKPMRSKEPLQASLVCACYNRRMRHILPDIAAERFNNLQCCKMSEVNEKLNFFNSVRPMFQRSFIARYVGELDNETLNSKAHKAF